VPACSEGCQPASSLVIVPYLALGRDGLGGGAGVEQPQLVISGHGDDLVARDRGEVAAGQGLGVAQQLTDRLHQLGAGGVSGIKDITATLVVACKEEIVMNRVHRQSLGVEPVKHIEDGDRAGPPHPPVHQHHLPISALANQESVWRHLSMGAGPTAPVQELLLSIEHGVLLLLRVQQPDSPIIGGGDQIVGVGQVPGDAVDRPGVGLVEMYPMVRAGCGQDVPETDMARLVTHSSYQGGGGWVKSKGEDTVRDHLSNQLLLYGEGGDGGLEGGGGVETNA